jgi:hypothetical protein
MTMINLYGSYDTTPLTETATYITSVMTDF